MHLRVRYHRASEFLADHQQQLARGGLLVRVSPEPTLQQFDAVDLAIEFGGTTVVLKGQIVQMFAGVGIAITCSAGNSLDELVTKATQAGEQEAPKAEHLVCSDRREEAVVESTIAQTTTLALRGNRDERSAIMRDQNPTMHMHVLRNPGLQLDEVAAIAKMRTVSAELLKAIAEKREWAQRAEIAIALIRNPKTPVAIGIKLLDHVSTGDLRQLAKDTHTRGPIQQAARKKVLT
ncbi:MAG: hypothetical protein NVSMB1_12180 [Polyangiales bacterium]